MRSKWKDKFLTNEIINYFLKKKDLNSKDFKNKNLKNNLKKKKLKNFHIFSRTFVIIHNFVNKYFFMYTGCKFKRLKIKSDMVNHKIKEFVMTKALTKMIHLKKKKKNKMKNKIKNKK